MGKLVGAQLAACCFRQLPCRNVLCSWTDVVHCSLSLPWLGASATGCGHMGCTQRMWGLGMGVTRGNSESGHSTHTRQQRVLTVETSGAKKGGNTERGASRVGMECRARSGVAQAPIQNPRVCRYSGADNTVGRRSLRGTSVIWSASYARTST